MARAVGFIRTIMSCNKTHKILEFLEAMEVFISGRRRGTIFVREIEGMFAELFDDDERFEDLQYALAMFGAGKDSRHDEDWLIREFKFAKKIIEAERELRRSTE